LLRTLLGATVSGSFPKDDPGNVRIRSRDLRNRISDRSSPLRAMPAFVFAHKRETEALVRRPCRIHLYNVKPIKPDRQTRFSASAMT
jgi:hypothetical protein